MLPQLVGLSCAVCSQRVGSEIDGHFCEGCGNPIHNACARRATPPVPTGRPPDAPDQPRCARCGCTSFTPVAERVRFVREFERQLPTLRPYLLLRKQRITSLVMGGLAWMYVVCMYVSEWDDEWNLPRPMLWLYGFAGVVSFLFATLTYLWELRAKARWESAQASDSEPPG